MINELHDMAGQHEMITENLTTTVLKELTALIHELKQERKKVRIAIKHLCISDYNCRINEDISVVENVAL